MATAGDARGPGPERAYVERIPDAGDVVLDGPESSHLVRSRRAKVDDVVVLFDGLGGSAEARLVAADPRAARLCVVGPYPDREPGRVVLLAVSPPEGGRTDEVVSAAAELGVETFLPLVCDRTPPKRAGQAERRTERWSRIALQSAKINGRSRLLSVLPPRTLGALLGERAPGVTVLLDPDPEAPPLPAVIKGAAAIRLLVGPEGGFTPEELARARTAGAEVARVGATVLRVETAAMAAAAIAMGTA